MQETQKPVLIVALVGLVAVLAIVISSNQDQSFQSSFFENSLTGRVVESASAELQIRNVDIIGESLAGNTILVGFYIYNRGLQEATSVSANVVITGGTVLSTNDECAGKTLQHEQACKVRLNVLLNNPGALTTSITTQTPSAPGVIVNRNEERAVLPSNEFSQCSCPQANTVTCGQRLPGNSCGTCPGTGTMCAAGQTCNAGSCQPNQSPPSTPPPSELCGPTTVGRLCSELSGGSVNWVAYACTSSLVGGGTRCCPTGTTWDGNACIAYNCNDMNTLNTQAKCERLCGPAKWSGSSCTLIDCNDRSDLTDAVSCQSCGYLWYPPDNACLIPLPTNASCALEPRMYNAYPYDPTTQCCAGLEDSTGQCRSICKFGNRVSDGCPPAPNTQRWPAISLQPTSNCDSACTSQMIQMKYDAYVTSAGVGFGAGMSDEAHMYYKAVAQGVIPDTKSGLDTLLAYNSVGKAGRTQEIDDWFSLWYIEVVQNRYAQQGTPKVDILSVPATPTAPLQAGQSYEFSGVQTSVPSKCSLNYLNTQGKRFGFYQELITTDYINHAINISTQITIMLNKELAENNRTVVATILCETLDGSGSTSQNTFLQDSETFTFSVAVYTVCDALISGSSCPTGATNSSGYSCSPTYDRWWDGSAWNLSQNLTAPPACCPTTHTMINGICQTGRFCDGSLGTAGQSCSGEITGSGEICLYGKCYVAGTYCNFGGTSCDTNYDANNVNRCVNAGWIFKEGQDCCNGLVKVSVNSQNICQAPNFCSTMAASTNCQVLS